MKTLPDSQPRLEYFIRPLCLILAFHLMPIFCRPSNHHGQNNTLHPSSNNSDLRIMAKFGEETKPRQSPPSIAVSLSRFNYNTHPIDGDSNDPHLSDTSDDYVSVGDGSINVTLARTIPSDVTGDVTTGFGNETTHGYVGDDGLSRNTTGHLMQADMNEVSIDEWVPKKRRRRARSSPNPDHRWRRRHKLLLKTRDSKDHLTGRRRDRFLLKEDGPGHIVFKAGEVKKDWCRTIRFDQNVTSGRCSKVVRNNLCYGQCNSFFIPQSEKGSSKVAFQSCAFCKPHRLRWVNVTLDCPPGRPRVVQKTILKVESCRCIAADAKEMDKNAEFLRKGARNIRVNQ